VEKSLEVKVKRVKLAIVNDGDSPVLICTYIDAKNRFYNENFSKMKKNYCKKSRQIQRKATTSIYAIIAKDNGANLCFVSV